jgi:protein-disulfide isomerase
MREIPVVQLVTRAGLTAQFRERTPRRCLTQMGDFLCGSVGQVRPMNQVVNLGIAVALLLCSETSALAQRQSQSSDAAAVQRLEDALRDLSRQVGELSTLLKASLPPLPIEDVEPFELSISRNAIRGHDSARLVLVEFSDFQCPFCRQSFQTVYPKLLRAYVDSGQLRYVFKNLPLEAIHPLARGAAEAAECARAQGKVWEMHGRLFEDQQKLSKSDSLLHATSLQIERVQFEACLGDPDKGSIIKQDVDEATKLGLTATPTFLIGEMTKQGTVMVRKRIAGAQPFDIFRIAIDSLLSAPAVSTAGASRR